MQELHPGDKLTTLFYNVENLFDTINNPLTRDDDFTPYSEKRWDTERYFDKQSKLSKVIAASDKKLPAFIGLAEVENKRVLEDLINTRRLKNAGYGIVHEQSPDTRGIDVGFLYKKSVFAVDHYEAITVSFPFDRTLTTRDILYVKGFTAADERIHFFVNHWSSRREGKEETEPKRLQAATTLRNKIDLIYKEDKNAKIIVMGDFNDYPFEKSIVNVLRSTYEWPQPEDGLYNLVAEKEEIGGGTHNYRGDWGFLDQMMVSPSVIATDSGLSTDRDGVRVLKEEWMLFFHKRYREYKPNKTYVGRKYAGGYSDHLPLVLKLKIK
ncbi:MAG: endonuclease/exonuclease/phosphatase family protein [Cyclobacteriaceae bacterium]